MNSITVIIASLIMVSSFAFGPRSFTRRPPAEPPISKLPPKEIPPPAPPETIITVSVEK